MRLPAGDLFCIATVCQGEAVSCSAFFRSQCKHAQPVLFPARCCCGRLCLWLCHSPIPLCTYADEIIRTNTFSEKFSACRTAFLVAVAGLTAGVCLVSAASSLALLWLAAPLAGFAFGCHWRPDAPARQRALRHAQLRIPVLPAAVCDHVRHLRLCHQAGETERKHPLSSALATIHHAAAPGSGSLLHMPIQVWQSPRCIDSSRGGACTIAWIARSVCRVRVPRLVLGQ